MNPIAQTAVAELDGMTAWLKQAGIPEDTGFNAMWNWQQPAMSRNDLEAWISNARAKLARLPDTIPAGNTATALSRLPQQLTFFRSNVLPNLAGTNAMYVVPPLLELLDRAEKLCDAIVSPYPPPPPPDWQKLSAGGAMPAKLAERLTNTAKRIDTLVANSGDIEQKLAEITAAHDTAEQLPETMATLEEGKRAVSSAQTQAQSFASEASTHARDAADASAEIDRLAKSSAKKYEELEDAYRAAATKGLASSFQKKADDLGWSVRLWVAVLIADLAAGALIGYFRFEELQKILGIAQPPAVIWGNLVFSLLSIAAPVWLGWVATKQINQRFKLAEDYGFKASVASAYEAWKSEAKKQDKQFEERLFSSAMSRLEEAPLRFVEAENYGSPWHELISSPAFAKALEAVPDLRATLASVIASAGGAAAGAGAVVRFFRPKEASSADAAGDGE